MPPTSASISNFVTWNDILGSINAIAPILGLPTVLGVAIAISIGVLGYVITQTKKGFSLTDKPTKINVKPVRRVSDNNTPPAMTTITMSDAPPPPPTVSDDPIEQAILTQLQGGQSHIDDIVRETGLPTYQVSSALTMLELKGDIKGQAGGNYALTQATAAPADETPKKRTRRAKSATIHEVSEPVSAWRAVVDFILSLFGIKRRHSDPRYQRVEEGQPKVYIPIAERRDPALQDEIEAKQDEDPLTPPQISENLADLVADSEPTTEPANFMDELEAMAAPEPERLKNAWLVELLDEIETKAISVNFALKQAEPAPLSPMAAMLDEIETRAISVNFALKQAEAAPVVESEHPASVAEPEPKTPKVNLERLEPKPQPHLINMYCPDCDQATAQTAKRWSKTTNMVCQHCGNLNYITKWTADEEVLVAMHTVIKPRSETPIKPKRRKTKLPDLVAIESQAVEVNASIEESELSSFINEPKSTRFDLPIEDDYLIERCNIVRVTRSPLWLKVREIYANDMETYQKKNPINFDDFQKNYMQKLLAWLESNDKKEASDNLESFKSWKHKELNAPIPALQGKVSKAYGANPEQQYVTRYELRELSELVTSNDDRGNINPNYPQEMQPRDRSREASMMQITGIAQGLIADAFLSEFHSLDRGAPIVGQDNIVESGNGRTMGLRKAALDVPEKWNEYQSRLAEVAGEFGVDSSGYKEPVLVRVVVGEYDRLDFTKAANESAVLQMSDSERAKSDAAKISAEDLLALELGDDTDRAIQHPRNRGFIRSFLNNYAENERATMIDRDGGLTQSGLMRVKSALFNRVYDNDRLSDRLFESLDNDIKNITNGLMGSLGQLAQAEELIKRGERNDYSMAHDIAIATEKLSRLKQDGLTVEEYRNQGQLFGRELTDIQETILEELDKRKRSGKQVKEFISSWADLVLREPSPKQASFIPGKPTKEELMERWLNPPKQQASLF